VGAVSGVVEMVGVARGLVGAGQWGEALDVVDELDALWANQAGTSHSTSAAVHPTPNTDGRRSPLPTVAESPVTTISPSIPDPVAQTTSNKIPAPSIPISSLHAFGALPSNLRALTMQIASSLTSEIISVLKLDLIDRVDHLGSQHPSGMNGHAEQGMQMSLKDKLRPLLHSLARTGSIREATSSWREAVLTEVTSILKRVSVSPPNNLYLSA
jgi:vacuolar protein sorting-associated protein 54